MLRKAKPMIERAKLNAAEIEARCLEALRRRLGLRGLTYTKIRPYNGPKRWTWELDEAGPAAAGALSDSMDVVHELQQEFDLDLGERSPPRI